MPRMVQGGAVVVSNHRPTSQANVQAPLQASCGVQHGDDSELQVDTTARAWGLRRAFALMLLACAATVSPLTAAGPAATPREAVDVSTSRQQEISDTINALALRSPSFKEKWLKAIRSDAVVVVKPGNLAGKDGDTSIQPDGSILVQIDFDACARDKEPIARCIAHEIFHVSEMCMNPRLFMNMAKLERVRGVTYRDRSVEVAAFRFQAVAYNEFLGSAGGSQ